jgi:glutathione S-transferase
MTNSPSTSLHLYSAELCPYAMRVRHALAEKGLAFELTEIDPRNKPDGFAALSPLGRVPLLVNDADRIWEAAVICEYLEDAFPGAWLLPEDAASRARARAWITFADERLYGATSAVFHASDLAAAVRSAIPRFVQDILLLEEQGFGCASGDGPWLLGGRFSLADVALYPWFDQVCVLETFCGLPMPSAPRMEAWRKAMLERQGLRGIAKSREEWIEAYGRLLKARAA